MQTTGVCFASVRVCACLSRPREDDVTRARAGASTGHQSRQYSVLLLFFFILGEVYEQLLREVAVTRASECARLVLLACRESGHFLGAVADGLPLPLSSLSRADGAGSAASIRSYLDSAPFWGWRTFRSLHGPRNPVLELVDAPPDSGCLP